MKRVYDNERGIALVLALILSLVVLAAVSALVYLVTQGSTMSGYQKRYETALEAAKGAVNIVATGILPNAIVYTIGQSQPLSTTQNNLQTTYAPLGLSFSGPNIITTAACLNAKLTLPEYTGATDNWKTVGNCTADMKSPYITSLTSANPNENSTVLADMSFVLQGLTASQNYIVYAKIVDTTIGNTDTSGLNLQGQGVVSNNGMITPPPVNYLYKVEILAQRQNNPDERAYLSAHYAW